MGSISNPVYNTPIDPVQVITAVISAAQFKAMDGTTPTSVTLTPAPAANQFLEVLEWELNMQFPVSGGIAYATGAQNFGIGVDNGVGSIAHTWGALLTPGAIKTGASQYTTNRNPWTTPAGLGVAQVGLGKPLQCNILTTPQYTGGNGIFVITVRYRVVTLV